MSVATLARPFRARSVAAITRRSVLTLAACVTGGAVGWLLMGNAGLIIAAVALAVVLPLTAGATLGYGGFAVALVAGSMLPLPTLSVGTVQFPFAIAVPPLLLAGGVVVARQRGVAFDIPHLMPYAALIALGVVSVVCSYFYWDPRVGTAVERGFGHRWIGYQLTGLYFLAVPLLAFAAGVLLSRLMRVERLYMAVFAIALGLTGALLFAWLQHPLSPLDAFSERARTRVDNAWAAYLLVMSTALLLYAPDLLMRVAAMAMLAAGVLATGVAYVLSAWLGVLAAVTAVIWLRFRSRGLVLWLVALLVGAVVVQSVLAAIVLQRASSPDVDRVRLWQSALTVWTRSPVIGVGPGNLASYMEAFNAFPLRITLHGYQEPHNIFLEILSENGAVGFLLFAGFIGLVTRALTRARCSTARESFAVAAGLGLLCVSAGTAAFGGGFVPTIASAGYNALPTIVLVWVLAGCAVGVARRPANRPQPMRALQQTEGEVA